MTLSEIEWRDEYLIYPAVKRMIAVLSRMTAHLYVAAALFWVAGLGLLCFAPADCVAAFVATTSLADFFVAAAAPGLYLSALWCHHVLLAGRGVTATRRMLFFMLFFAFLHPVCVGYEMMTGAPLLVNQSLLPAVLYTVLPSVFFCNWFRMTALPLRYRLLLLLFFICLLGRYILQGSFLMLLLPCFSYIPLRLLAHYAPQIVSLPPRDAGEQRPSETMTKHDK